MRILLLRGLALLAAIALVGPATSAQTVLFNFEGPGGDTQGWEPNEAPDTSIGEGARSGVKTVDSKAIGMVNGAQARINAFRGMWLLEAIPNRPIPANEFRGMKYTWSTPQDFSATPILKVAASMNANGPDSELHQYRIRVVSGTGATADTTEMIYDGLKSEGAGDGEDNNSFVNDWEVLTLDLSGFAGVNAVTQIETTGRHADDASTTGMPKADSGPWGGLVHLDYVTVEAAAGGGTSSETGPGLASLGDVYPNPTASGASLAVEVSSAQRVTATVYDVLGRQVARAFDGPLAPGATALLRLDTARLAPGTYVVRLEGETFSASRRLSVAR